MKNIIKEITSILYSNEYYVISNTQVIKPDVKFDFGKLSANKIKKIINIIEKLLPNYEFDIIDTICFVDKKKIILDELKRTIEERKKKKNFFIKFNLFLKKVTSNLLFKTN